MPNIGELRTKIDESGLKIGYIANNIGVSRHTFYNKLAGKSDFSATQISTLTKLLDLSKTERDKIFF